jgi:hypothetical protein
VHGEGGQATVEWVALVLLAALVLGAAAALSRAAEEHSLGQLVAKRIARGPSEVGRVGTGRAPAPIRLISTPRRPPSKSAADAFPQLRGVGQVARHAWVVCLGYRRWRHELDSPLAPTEALPLGDALGIVNDCLNPHDYLLAD